MNGKTFLAAAAVAFSIALVAVAQTVPPEQYSKQVPLLSAVAATGAGSNVRMPSGPKTYQVTGSVASGTGSAVVNVEGSNNGTQFDVIGTASVPLTTTTASVSFTSLDRYVFTRGNVTTLTGSTPTLSVTAAY